MESMGSMMADIKQRAEAAMMQKSKDTSTEIPKLYDCEKCKDSGTLHHIEWAESEELKDKHGKPLRYEKTKLELCECHYQKQFDKYNVTDKLNDQEQTHTFKNALLDKENQPHFEIGVQFVKDIKQHMEEGSWLYIYGDEERAEKYNCSAYGTGKTYLMQCIGNALSHRKIPALYIDEETLFSDIKETYNRNSAESEADVLRRYYKVPILLIDDLFSAQYKEWAESKLYSILDNRMKDKKVTIITSNYAVNRIRERLPINGAKIASRIIGQAQQIEMIGRDRRLKKAMDRRKGWSA